MKRIFIYSYFSGACQSGVPTDENNSFAVFHGFWNRRHARLHTGCKFQGLYIDYRKLVQLERRCRSRYRVECVL